MNLSRIKPLDWVLIVAYVAFVGIEVYRYRTQGTLPVADLVFAAIASVAYWGGGYRSPKGSRNPNTAEWLTGVSLAVVGVCVGGGLIWTFGMSDSSAQRWHHAAISAGAAALSAVACAWTVIRTARKPTE